MAQGEDREMSEREPQLQQGDLTFGCLLVLAVLVPTLLYFFSRWS